MSSDKHIPQSTGNDKGKTTPLSDEQLMAYLEGTLNREEQRLLEELMSEESPEADAIEGLNMMHTAESKRSVAELHRKLHTEILRNNPKRKNKFSSDFWSWIAIVIILLLIVVGYIVVRIAS